MAGFSINKWQCLKSLESQAERNLLASRRVGAFWLLGRSARRKIFRWGNSTVFSDLHLVGSLPDRKAAFVVKDGLRRAEGKQFFRM
jgi:hypothetical protein